MDAHGTAPVSGEQRTVRISEHFWIEDERITEIRPFYRDPAGLRPILGMGWIGPRHDVTERRSELPVSVSSVMRVARVDHRFRSACS